MSRAGRLYDEDGIDEPFEANLRAAMRDAMPPTDTDEYRVVCFHHGTGETLADVRRPSLGAARCRAYALHRKHGGEVVRVQQRGFDVAHVVNGEWRPVEKAVRT